MPNPTDGTAHKRLADHVRQRRVQLGMHKSDVAKAAEITINTYNKIEDGKPVRDLTYGKVEEALAWAPGSCRDILRGGEPTLIEGTSVQGIVSSPITPGDLAADIEQAVQDAAIAVTDGLSAADIRKLKQRVVEELRLRGRLSDSG